MEAGGIPQLQGGVATPGITASTVRMEDIVGDCVGRDALAGGSYAATAAGTWDAIGTIGTDAVLTEQAHCSVG